ncbi:unnamed protein product [Caenorhabditis auriculariae]|uniref:Uncharacterized protein n=1 Tax=Caenorhabditis auriculariae TaxID=2777116 RepID=A0A8S1HZ25_9PELO|nr:unnamed protein product [Caenorhabditis auriculariae]
MGRRRRDRTRLTQSESAQSISPREQPAQKSETPKANRSSGGGRRSDRSSRFGRQDGFTIADEDFPELPGARKQLSNEKTRGVPSDVSLIRSILNVDTTSTTSMLSSDSGVVAGGISSSSSATTTPPRNDTTTSSSSTTSPAAAASEKSTASPPFLKLTASRAGVRQPELRGGSHRKNRENKEKAQQTPERRHEPKSEPPPAPAPLMDVKVPVVPELQQVPQIECLPNGEIVNIPGSMLTDQFGLVALSPVCAISC